MFYFSPSTHFPNPIFRVPGPDRHEIFGSDVVSLGFYYGIDGVRNREPQFTDIFRRRDCG